jgi:hypothetical protein
MMEKTKSLPAINKADPFWLAKTPGMLRARIDVKEQFLKQTHPLSSEAWRLHQQIAELSRDLYEVENKGKK